GGRRGAGPRGPVQETYLRAYAAFGSYRGENTRAWLAAICLNTARSQARQRRRRPREVRGPALLDVLPRTRPDNGEGGADVADIVIAGLDAAEVSRCLGAAAGAAAGVHRAGGRGRVYRPGGGGGAGLPARDGAGPGAPGPAEAGAVAGRGGGDSWTPMTGCWRRSWPGAWTVRRRSSGVSTCWRVSGAGGRGGGAGPAAGPRRCWASRRGRVWPTGSPSPWRWPPPAARRGGPARQLPACGVAAMAADCAGGSRVPGCLPLVRRPRS